MIYSTAVELSVQSSTAVGVGESLAVCLAVWTDTSVKTPLDHALLAEPALQFPAVLWEPASCFPSNKLFLCLNGLQPRTLADMTAH